MKIAFPAVSLAVLLLGGCASAPPPSIDTREADIAAVKAVEEEWNKVAATRDVDKFLSFYADDAVILMPNLPPIRGRDGVRADITSMMADPNYALTFKSEEIHASKGGDVVYTLGSYTSTATDPKTKQPITDKGKGTAIYRKQPDGSWKCVVDMISSDLPAAH
jgi:uncharacterized protein (TIGR02246 family)